MDGATKELESNTLNMVVRKNPDKDVDDLTEEVNNLASVFKDFKAELIEDMCQVIGIWMDKYAMEQFNKKNQQQQQK